MSTLYKRATAPQAMMLRIVEGAVKNACDAHQVGFNPYLARSIAKRAAGTLSAEMSAVLAANPSEKIGVAAHSLNVARSARLAQVAKPDGTPNYVRVRAGQSHPSRAAPLRSLERWMFRQMRAIKNSGNEQRANAFIDVLREISKLKDHPHV